MSFLDNLSSLASRTGRYSAFTTGSYGTATYDIPRSEQEEYKTNNVFDSKIAEDDKKREKQKLLMTKELNIARDRYAIVTKKEIQNSDISGDEIKIEEQWFEDTLAKFDSAIKAVKDSKNWQELKNLNIMGMSYNQVLGMGSSYSDKNNIPVALPDSVAYPYQAKGMPFANQPSVSGAPQPTTPGAPAPQGQAGRGSRVLSNIKGGKGVPPKTDTTVPPVDTPPVEKEGAWVSDNKFGATRLIEEDKSVAPAPEVKPEMNLDSLNGSEQPIGTDANGNQIVAKFDDKGNATLGFYKEVTDPAYTAMPGKKPETHRVWNQTGGVAANEVKFHPQLQGIPAVAEAIKKNNEYRAPIAKPEMDKGRKALLLDIAQGNKIDTGASGQKYTTTLSPEEKSFVTLEGHIAGINKILDQINKTTDKTQQKILKGQLDGMKQGILSSDGGQQLWSQIESRVKMQGGLEANPKTKELKTKDEFKAAVAKLTPEQRKMAKEIYDRNIANDNATTDKANTQAIQNALNEVGRINWNAPTTTTPEPKGTVTSEKPQEFSASYTPREMKVGGDVNAGGATKVDTIEKSNAPSNLGQGQNQVPETAKAPLRFN